MELHSSIKSTWLFVIKFLEIEFGNLIIQINELLENFPPAPIICKQQNSAENKKY